jgi:hypothetical protein
MGASVLDVVSMRCSGALLIYPARSGAACCWLTRLREAGRRVDRLSPRRAQKHAGLCL